MAEPTVPRLRRRTLALKAEGVYGTDVFGGTVVAGDLVPCYNLNYALTNSPVDTQTQSGLGGQIGPDSQDARSVEITYNIRLRGKGAAYAALGDVDVAESLRVCGCKETLVVTAGSESLTYAPREPGGLESFTAYLLRENAPTIKAVGVFGNAILSTIAGQPWELQVRLVGAVVVPSDITLVTSAFSKTPVFPTARGAALSLNSITTHRMQNLALDFGNIVELRESQNATEAREGAMIMGRSPRLTLDPETVTVATQDLDLLLRNGTIVPWSLNSDGLQYNRVKLSGAAAQVLNLSPGTRGELQTDQLELKVLIDTGEDDWEIAFD